MVQDNVGAFRSSSSKALCHIGETGIFNKIEKPGAYETTSLKTSHKQSPFKLSIFFVCYLGKLRSFHSSGYHITPFSLSWQNSVKCKKFSSTKPIVLKRLKFGTKKPISFQSVFYFHPKYISWSNKVQNSSSWMGRGRREIAEKN